MKIDIRNILNMKNEKKMKFVIGNHHTYINPEV